MKVEQVPETRRTDISKQYPPHKIEKYKAGKSQFDKYLEQYQSQPVTLKNEENNVTDVPKNIPVTTINIDDFTQPAVDYGRERHKKLFLENL